jgi:hypothetical protein
MFRSTTALAAALALGVSGAALAQTAPEFPQEKLEAFAEAALSIQEIRTEASTQLQQAETPDEQRALMDDANARMTAEVEDNPAITIDEYNEIVVAAQQDPELADRVASLMDEAAAR